MDRRELFNFITGIMGFITWIYLVKDSPENGLILALGVLLVLLGFGGRETIKDILKSWKQ